MKNFLLLILTLCLISYNKLSKEVENSFSTMGIKLDSLNSIKEKKIETLFIEINSKRIKKNDGENSAFIYYSTIKHNQAVDSLINELKSVGENELRKKEISDRFEFEKVDLKTKLNSITEFNTMSKIDSLLKSSNDIKVMPNFAMVSEFQSGKLNASESAELLLLKLKEKTRSELYIN